MVKLKAGREDSLGRRFELLGRADGPRGEVRADHLASTAVLADPPEVETSVLPYCQQTTSA